MTVSKKRRLGRGLEALLGPTTIPDARSAGELKHVAVTAIQPNPFQPRRAFDQSAIDELASSMASSGLLQPVVLRPYEDGTYQLIAGERRWRAALQLEWREIGAVLRDVDDRMLLTLALVENLQRDALTAIDEAIGYKRLVEDFQISHAEIANLVGKNRSTVANSLRLLNLPVGVQEMVQTGDLQMGHARALLQLSDTRAIERLARLVVKLGLSVRDTESRARGVGTNRREQPERARKPARKSSVEVKRVEDALRKYLKTDATITQNASGRGRLEIDFYSNDDLARVLELVLGAPFDG
jgi:ParB family transcriptional regulator, chromosome partitioning protein